MEECRFHIDDVVQHFKRENVNLETVEYLYRILAFAQHTENDEKLVIYQALYPPYKTCARPYDIDKQPGVYFTGDLAQQDTLEKFVQTQ